MFFLVSIALLIFCGVQWWFAFGAGAIAQQFKDDKSKTNKIGLAILVSFSISLIFMFATFFIAPLLANG